MWVRTHAVHPRAGTITSWVDAPIDREEGSELRAHILSSLMVAAAHRLHGITLGWLLMICSPTWL